MLAPVLLGLASLTAAQACPPQGEGGDWLLNLQKNRDRAPERFEDLDVAAILELPRHYPVARWRARWPEAVKNEVDAQERRGVTLEGYLLAAHQSGPESCNCHDRAARDFHLWIGAAPATDTLDAKLRRAQAVVVEMTPRLRALHPSWRLRTLERLAHDRVRVRVQGWLMYDPEHPGELGKSRGTLWEVHPITGFQIFSGGRWLDL